MRKLPAYLLAILIGGLIWVFFSFFKIDGVGHLRVVPKTEAELNRASGTNTQTVENPSLFERIRNGVAVNPNRTGESQVNGPVGSQVTSTGIIQSSKTVIPITSTNPAVAPTKSADSIRIGSFNLHHFGSSASDPRALEIVAQIVRYFDIIALQGIAPGGRGAVMDVAKRAGDYEAIFGAPADVQHMDERFAFVFNRGTIVADRGHGLYTLGDRDKMLTRDPLVGWFRAKRAREDLAFTFSLVNVSTDAKRRKQELDVLDEALHAIREDGREEDDVIMLGSFQAPHNQLGQLGRVASLATAIIEPPTDLGRETQTENIVFRSIATDEYRGRSDVFQFRQALNLSLEEAREVSDHVPIWAEFSIFETGQPMVNE